MILHFWKDKHFKQKLHYDLKQDLFILLIKQMCYICNAILCNNVKAQQCESLRSIHTGHQH